MTKKSMLQISRPSTARELPSSSSPRWIAPRHCLSSSGVSWIPIQPDRPYFAMRLAERLGSLSPLKKIGGGGVFLGLAPHPPPLEVAGSPLVPPWCLVPLAPLS